MKSSRDAAGVKTTSLWADTGPAAPELPPLEGHVDADVAVIGGGIVGITTAFLLREAGRRVVLLEAGRLACGVSGYTTAKVTSQHGLIYARLRSALGPEAARTYGAANEAALAWIAQRAEQDGVECDFRRRPAYAYVSAQAKRSAVEEEVEAAVEAGLPATLSETTPLPYPVEAAVRFDEQGEFHVRKYLLRLADRLRAGTGCELYEQSRALGLQGDDGCLVETAAGTVAAERVIVATHYPFLDRSLAFARVRAERSYAIACRIAGPPPAGMFISAESPTRSLRAVPVDGEELLLVGGESHKPGSGGDTEKRYERLESFAREHWEVRAVEYRWSSQDNITIHGVPYVGKLTPRSERVLMATGFAKWGMTGGTAAAMVLANMVLDRPSPAAGLFNPHRVTPLGAARALAIQNAETAFHFFADRIRKPGVRSIDDLRPGEGDIVHHGAQKVAAYRDNRGVLVAVSTRCTHLGCQLSWNRAERSWDCPCHGSRFAPGGEVLQGPAVQPLERKRLT